MKTYQPNNSFRALLKTSSVECPNCGKKIVWAKAEKFRPFCSERCRQIDFGEWAQGSYTIPMESGKVTTQTIEPD